MFLLQSPPIIFELGEQLIQLHCPPIMDDWLLVETLLRLPPIMADLLLHKRLLESPLTKLVSLRQELFPHPDIIAELEEQHIVLFRPPITLEA